MQLEPIIAALRARCPTFSSRVAGAFQFRLLPENSQLQVPCAYVIPLDDNPQDSASANSVRQMLDETFAIVVAVSNLTDERGQNSAAAIHAIRAELWAALLGWQPTDDYEGITYEGGQLLSVDRARLWYQFEFGASMEIGPEDGYQGTALAGLPPFEGANLQLDPVDPRDPNAPGSGPDGRNVVTFTAPPSGDFEQ